MPVKVPAIRFYQKGVPMYLTALRIDDLDLCSIDRYDPQKIAKWKGYQRGLNEEKIRNLAKYLERDDGILPVPGLLNVREKGALQFSDGPSRKPTHGVLTISDYTPLWVVDMQHRLEGIKLAHSNAVLDEFYVPVLITEGLPAVNEAAQFYVINTQSKRMGVDLTRRLLIEHDLIKDITDVPEWELKAVRIAIKLNSQIRGNPWYQRIREPEAERMRDQVATEKSFVPSLKWLLTSPEAKSKQPAHLARFLAAYWEGIRTNLPRAFESPRAHLIQKTPGFMAFHRLAPIVYRRHPDARPSTYKRLFAPLSGDSPYGERFWLAKNKHGAKRYGTGQSAYATLAIDLKKRLGI
jgi:DGQHR domain-containing protein